MKKVLIRNNIILMMIVFTLFILVIFLTLFSFHRKQQDELMMFLIDEVELSYLHFEGSDVAFVALFQNENNRRITILDEQAIVLADSHDASIGEDKSNRPELQTLNQVVRRHSDTVDLDMLYIAKQIDGGFLRVSVPLEPQVKTYNQVVLLWVISSFVFIGSYYLGLVQVNKNLLSPYYQVKKGMTAIRDGRYQLMSLAGPYPEINEILHEMNEINLDISKHIHASNAYQQQLNHVLNEIKQGVLLFNNHDELLYFNEDARRILNISNDSLQKKSYYAIRNKTLQDAITQVNENNKTQVFDVNLDGQTFETRVFTLSESVQSGKDVKILVLLKDVSKERVVEQMKRDFFAHASHELKSPLTAIRGFAELLEHHLVKNEDIEKAARQIVNQTQTMTALVEDMLMLSRLEHLTDQFFSNQALDHLLESEIKSLEPVAKLKNIVIQKEIEKIEMMCDPLDIQKLFKNIIENSIKYSYDNQSVDVRLYQKEEHIYFDVTDHGIGIDKDHQQRVFERFYRVDKGRTDGGTGLGLAIVKHIVIKYKGTIQLKSSLSKGTQIIIEMKRDM